MPDRVAWTDAGKAAFAEWRGRGFPVIGDTDVTAKVKALHGAHVPAWKRGLAKGDGFDRGHPLAEGGVLAELAIAWKPGGKPNVAALAAVMSLASACSNDEEVQPWFAAYVVRTYGFETALRVLVAMWPIVPSYTGTKQNAAWLTVIAADHPHIFDTSASAGKREYARYLSTVAAADRPTALANVWPSAPRYAKPALAIAARDPVRGAEIAKELLKDDKPHAFYAWDHLPHLLRDPKLVEKTMAKREQKPSIAMVDSLGVKLVPLLVARFAESMDKHSRLRVMQLAENFESDRIARILAEYAGEQPYAPLIQSYFTRFPKLLKKLLGDLELRYYHDELLAIQRTLT